MPGTGVQENNRVTLSKSRTEGTWDRIRQHATVIILRLSKIQWTIPKPRTSQVNLRCIVPERVTHRFARWCKPYRILWHDAITYNATFHSSEEEEEQLVSCNHIKQPQQSLKLTTIHSNSLKATISHPNRSWEVEDLCLSSATLSAFPPF
jgi:hypothetical protein